jgi:hypothetical protein
VNEVGKYLKAVELGFDHYGLKGFYQMHYNFLENKEKNYWDYELEVLNELNKEEFESLCKVYLTSI